jgi:hypothetical protein
MSWGLRVCGISAGLGLVLGLAGCTVPAGGAVGMTVDANGQPMAVVQMCEGHIDGTTVYISDDDPEKVQTLGVWRVEPALTGFSQFSFATGGDGWQVDQAFKPRDEATTYSIYGWSDDNSWSASHFHFSQADLAKLQAGKVLYSAFDDADSQQTGSVEEFKSDVCEQDWG